MYELMTEAAFPPFLFHYIIVIVCVMFIMCVCVLKFKYLYWYSQPLTFRFTIRRFGGTKGRPRTSIMNPLSLGERCYNAVVYPFLNNVNHTTVRVYIGGGDDDDAAPFERIAAFLSRRETEIMMPGRREIKMDSYMCIPEDTLRIILSQDTFGLSAFIGVLNDPMRGGGDVIKGVSILTPRIMLSFESSSTAVPYRSVSIYMCDYIAWERYTVGERESLELLETTEYIQKSREIAGEQTLYRYREIPWFVIPFSTVYSYTFSMPEAQAPPILILGDGMSVVAVSSVNFALFYSFINECSRDFRCCIFNELTQLQSLVDRGLYRIYMLIFNQVRVVAVYLFAPSWMKAMKPHSSITAAKTSTKNRMTTKGNRISDLHKYISNTSTALVKYIPPVITPKYDAFGKRITTSTSTSKSTIAATDESILLLMSSIQHKTLCDKTDFVSGFKVASRMVSSINSKKGNNSHPRCIMIDTLAHNYRLIDDITVSASKASAWKLLSQDKWYYILYNAIIHEQTLCKDILLV